MRTAMKTTNEEGWNREKRDSGRELWSRDGLLGHNCDMPNAHTVEQHYNYNGSGGAAFGGANQWPVVSCKVSFVVGEEKRAAHLAERLRRLINAEFGSSEGENEDD